MCALVLFFVIQVSYIYYQTHHTNILKITTY